MEYKLSKPINEQNSVIVYSNTQLGKGAQAIVYKASVGGKVYAAKIFHDDTKFDVQKINAMIANPPDKLEGLTAGINYPRYSWPIAIIEESNKAIGYLMPLIDLEESFTLDHYYDKNLGIRLNSPDEVALSYRVEIAANLSALIKDLHSHGHYFIDFKPQNIRVFKRTHAVTLIDCDGFSIKSLRGKQYPADLLSSDYISPEAYRNKSSPKDLGEDQDRYALAVIIFQLLNGGIHPFQGIPLGPLNANTNDEKAAEGLYPHGLVPHNKITPRPQSVHNCIDETLRSLFDKAFMGISTTRPTANVWTKSLSLILKNKQITRCDKYPYDIRHMRFIGKDCPECHSQNNKKPVLESKDKSQNLKDRSSSQTSNQSGNNQAKFTSTHTAKPKSRGFSGFLIWLIICLSVYGFMNLILNYDSVKTASPPEVAEIKLDNQSSKSSNPVLTSVVTDLTATLSLGQIESLEKKIRAFEASKGIQIIVLLVPTTQPETIKQYSIRVLENFKVNGKTVDNLVLILVAQDDRRFRIEVGSSVSNVANDFALKQIIDEVIFHYFKKNLYFDGINASIDLLIKVIVNHLPIK